MYRQALIAAALLSATPAAAKDVPDSEYVFQALNIIDGLQTIDCLKRDVCHEANPLLGRNPSTGKLVAVKVGTGVIHYLIARRLYERNPRAAHLFETISIGIQGGIVAANLRFAF